MSFDRQLVLDLAKSSWWRRVARLSRSGQSLPCGFSEDGLTLPFYWELKSSFMSPTGMQCRPGSGLPKARET